MRMNRLGSGLISVVGFFAFLIASQWRGEDQKPAASDPVVGGRVVIAAPVMLVLFAGDRFLAANLETMRLAATGVDWGRADTNYLVRAQYEVARLNPCHEDNYYLANGLLTWGGAEKDSGEILLGATNCRFWDEFPPFFYGFNKYFFDRDKRAAAHYLELAAERSNQNAAGFRKFSIMIRVKGLKDERMALDILRQEYEGARDLKLKEMLRRRMVRLEGLAVLRDAQVKFERKYGKALSNPSDLIVSGVLKGFPEDPLKLGYDFVNGRFMLREIKVAGLGGD